MKLIKVIISTALITIGATAFAGAESLQPNLSVGNSTQHFLVKVIYQTPSQPYDHQISVQQNFATPMPGFPEGEGVKVTRVYFTNPDDSIVSDSTNNAGCSEIDKNRFYTWVMIQASEKDNRPQLSCTSAY